MKKSTQNIRRLGNYHLWFQALIVKATNDQVLYSPMNKMNNGLV